MANRYKRASIAAETLQILNKGIYTNNSEQRVNIKEAVKSSTAGSILYTPEQLNSLSLPSDRKASDKTTFNVTNETTFSSAKNLQSKYGKVISLNFASAKNPGGGFLGGSHAQEECLARASALYPTIVQMESMYTTNRQYRSCLYTDHMIYSPDVPVFRDDEDNLLNEYWLTSIITAPAVNYGALNGHERNKTELTMRRRINQVLSIAQTNGYQNLVLGAWGCGVFKNDPKDIAKYFFDALSTEGKFYNTFQRINFAVLDSSKEKRFITPFLNFFS